MNMRNAIIQLAKRRGCGQHPGLLLQSYLSKDATSKEYPAEKHALFQAAIAAARNESLQEVYQLAFSRWNETFADDGLNPCADLHTKGRLIVGLGSENVLEAGIRLHHTYGLPVIPGSALKGLASHYCDHVWGQRHAEDSPDENRPFQRDGQYHDLLFGKMEDGGVVAFHDAWLIADGMSDGPLMLDVMTPHHLKWQNNEAPPTDFDSPVPVGFLSVSGAFRVRVSWVGPSDSEHARKWAGLTLQLLTEALAEWGIGGKTSSGYGRLATGDVVATASTGDAAPKSSGKPSKPKYARGDQVTVTRIEDSSKGKRQFQADDDYKGVMDAGDGPDVAVGETARLWIANVTQGYTFSASQLKAKSGKQASHQKKRRR